MYTIHQSIPWKKWLSIHWISWLVCTQFRGWTELLNKKKHRQWWRQEWPIVVIVSILKSSHCDHRLNPVLWRIRTNPKYLPIYILLMCFFIIAFLSFSVFFVVIFISTKFPETSLAPTDCAIAIILDEIFHAQMLILFGFCGSMFPQCVLTLNRYIVNTQSHHTRAFCCTVHEKCVSFFSSGQPFIWVVRINSPRVFFPLLVVLSAINPVIWNEFDMAGNRIMTLNRIFSAFGSADSLSLWRFEERLSQNTITICNFQVA